MAKIISATISGSTLTITYDEAMTSVQSNSLYSSTGDSISIVGSTGNNTNIWTLTLNAIVAVTDYLVMSIEYNSAKSTSSGTYLASGTAFIGGSGNTMIDFAGFDQYYTYPLAFFGNGGADTLLVSSESSFINLGGTDAASDTVGFGDQWNDNDNASLFRAMNLVRGFDVTGTSTNDKLNLLSGLIAANATNVNGVDVGTIVSHSITNGIVSFKDAGGYAIIIDAEDEFCDAFNYLDANITAVGTTVGYRCNTVVNALVVFQKETPFLKGYGQSTSFIVALDGISGATIGNTNGTNVVQITDTTAPDIQQSTLNSAGLSFYFSETVTAINTSGMQWYKNGTVDMGPVTPTIHGAMVSFASTTTTLSPTDFVVFDTSAFSGTATDSFGNTGDYSNGTRLREADGMEGNNTIDLSVLADVTLAYGNGGDDAILGTTGADRLNGGDGNDFLDGGAGNDRMDGGDGDDTYVVRDAGDTCTEYGGDDGNDTVLTYLTDTYLDNWYGIDALSIMGTTAANAYGNNLSNIMIGNSAENILQGGLGADTLTGGAGNDQFIYSSWQDSTANQSYGGVDSITDFQAGDRLEFSGIAGIYLYTAPYVWTTSVNDTVTNIKNNNLLNNTAQFFTDGIDGWLYIKGAGTGTSYNDSLIKLADRTTPLSGSNVLLPVVDTTAPTVTIFNPIDGATGVATTANLVATFSESIQRGMGNIALRSAAGTVIETFDAVTSNRLSISGSTLTVNPTSDLAVGTQYYLTFASGTIKDLVGNSYAGTTSYDFTTVVENTAPRVTAFYPSDGATNTALDTNIQLYFSESIQRGTGDIVLRTATGAVVETFNAATSNRLSIFDTYLSIDPTNYLASGASYYVTFDAGTIKDLAGNSYAGTTTYDFTAVVDSTSPTVVSFTPNDGVANVATNANITLTFNEKIQRGVGSIVLKSAAGTIIETYDAAMSSRLSISGSTLTIDPTSTLANNTQYFVNFASGTVKDLADNSYAGTSTYDFTTNSSSLTGQPVIDLGSYGKLIAPVQVDGKWYYYWDRSGDGTSSDPNSDATTHDVLDSLFIEDVNGSTGGGDNTNNTYRYATLNGVRVALPTDGVGVGDNIITSFPLIDNQSYTDLTEIWDTFNNSGGNGGLPLGWTDRYYWSASPSWFSATSHTFLSLSDGWCFNTGDFDSACVALEVLAPVATPSLSIAATNANKAEGNSGSTAFTFTVTRSGSSAGTSTVAYAVSGGTVSANDFTGGVLPSGTVSFAAGETSNTLTINISGDTTPESAENFTVTLTNPSGATIETATSTGTIENDDNIAPALIKGTWRDDTLCGGPGHNTLYGYSGNDSLDGGADADTMLGGMGNDTYYVDDTRDVVTETRYWRRENGVDTVVASIDWILGLNCENLTLMGSAQKAEGNCQRNILIGNDENNLLDGLAGADTMRGGLGNDIYMIENMADQTIETSADLLEIDTVLTSVNRTLGAHLENLTLTGTSAINGAGNSLDNILLGNDAANKLRGAGGNDILTSGSGQDIIYFDTPLDATNNIDTLTDFTAGEDLLRLDRSIFTSLTAGSLNPDNFLASTTGQAGDGNDYLLYNTSTGDLLYDADGNGAGAGIRFATLSNSPSITAASCLVVG